MYRLSDERVKAAARGLSRLVCLCSALAAAGACEAPPRSFPAPAPFVAFYGTADDAGDLDRFRDTFRVFSIGGAPDFGGWTDDQLEALRAGGRNRVLSYLNIGACERWVSYWATAPAGFVACGDNVAAQLGSYGGYDEEWMNPGNLDFQNLVVDYLAAEIMRRPVDGLFLDNISIAEHGPSATEGPCDPACAQGALDLVRRLRERWPDALIVINNGFSDVTRLGVTGGRDFPSLIDGVHAEGLYYPTYLPALEGQMLAWKELNLSRGGHPFWFGTTDYVGGCDQVDAAKGAYERSRARGFSPYASDASNGVNVVCYWPF